jgi:phage recombination protein Bet
MATRFSMEPAEFERTLRATVVPANVSTEQFAAFLVVAKKYQLDPITKQIYAFPAKGGGIQPIVSIDGWMFLINSHPQFDGMEFEDQLDERGAIVSITCRMFRKDRAHPVSVTEYMAECRRSTDPWKQWPARMLRHKAAIQAARYAFGFSGIVDPDEAERTVAADASPQPRAELAPYPEHDFDENLPKWREVIQSGRRTPDQIIAMVETKGSLSDEQREAIRNCAAVDAESEEVDPDGPIPGLDDDDPASEGGAP